MFVILAKGFYVLYAYLNEPRETKPAYISYAKAASVPFSAVLKNEQT